MSSQYHPGEITMQSSVGVLKEAQEVEKAIKSTVSPAARSFLLTQRMVIVSTVDTEKQVWMSLLTGEPGFIEAIEERKIQIKPASINDKQLRKNLLTNNQIGTIVIDLLSRRRLRLNGKVVTFLDNTLTIHTSQVYFNCPKYIQARKLKPSISDTSGINSIQEAKQLTTRQQDWLEQADTFFIASYHPESGADVSHRGGYPGFVKVLDPSQILFPDYLGNNMFNTLGNVVLNPHVALLFIDFELGHTLQILGKANVIMESASTADFAGAERLVKVKIARAMESSNFNQLRWHLVEYSPFNPI